MTTTTELTDLLDMQQALTSDSPVPEDVTDRTAGLGGSDAAAVAGISSYTSPLDVYLRATGEAESSADTYATRRGTVLEPILREEYERQTGRSVRSGGTMRHPKYPWMLAHTDGRIDATRILEIKTAGLWVAQDWGDAGTDEIPEQYMLQVQHYLSVTGAEICDVCAEIAGRDVQLFEVPRNKELIEMIEDLEAAFWKDHVLARVAPEPTDCEEAKKLWQRGRPGQSVEATDEVIETLALWMELRALAKSTKERAEAFKLDLQIVLGDAEALVDASGKKLLTWKNNKDGERFDVAAFKAKHPDLHTEFMRSSHGARVFRPLKAAESL